MREIRMLRSTWRGLETESRLGLHGHERGNPGYRQGHDLTDHRASPRPYPVLTGEFPAFGNREIRANEGLLRSRSIFQPEEPGDGGFAASKAQQSAFFSVAKFGGSDSLLIPPSQRQNFRDPYREFEILIGPVRRFVFAPDSPKSTESSNSTCSAIQSAVAETSRMHLGTVREVRAIPRGFGGRALGIRTGDAVFGA